ncbi:MAG TPA: hypothetical protein VLV83_07435 [Acidobacteriota bacterium]|nr:hypothetical protein [Acidobacteriota bacterium]
MRHGDDARWKEAWETLGSVSPRSLEQKRLELHHAAQIVAAVGKTYLEPRPDDSHPNMGWVEEGSLLVGRAVPDLGLRAALRVPQLTLLLCGDQSQVLDELPLQGRRVDQAMDWLARQMAAHGGGEMRPLSPAGYDIPQHEVAKGLPFAEGGERDRSELARWYANAHRALSAIASDHRGVQVRIWPHHFDIGLLIVIDPSLPPEETTSVGAGMTPGDSDYAEPYWYVNPYPRPSVEDVSQLPPLQGKGHWHTVGWLGAVLTASDLVGAEDSAGQAAQTEAYLRSALDAAGRLLGRQRQASS